MTELARTNVPPPEVRLVRIEPHRGWVSLKLGELWTARELVMFLVWRDIKVRYKQTALGAAWAVLQPIMTMVVFSIFFGKLAKLPSDGVPYPVFTFAALLPWNMFATGLTNASASLVGNTSLLKKVYVARLAIPVSAVLGCVVDFAIALVVLFVLMAGYGIAPSIEVIYVVPLALLALATALGTGIWLAALNVRYRDVKYVVSYLVQLWMFATPIAYSSSLITKPWLHTVFAINPMVGVVDGFRWALLGTAAPRALPLLTSIGVSLLMLLSGIIYFRNTERTFADVL